MPFTLFLNKMFSIRMSKSLSYLRKKIKAFVIKIRHQLIQRGLVNHLIVIFWSCHIRINRLHCEKTPVSERRGTTTIERKGCFFRKIAVNSIGRIDHSTHAMEWLRNRKGYRLSHKIRRIRCVVAHCWHCLWQKLRNIHLSCICKLCKCLQTTTFVPSLEFNLVSCLFHSSLFFILHFVTTLKSLPLLSNCFGKGSKTNLPM
mmetsp:Transcript_14931/g.22722  ORF Transcript_14931/g.22722 Transcript_14931/m.22722 type:complete len:202 (+) Transcript_14931:145-750(+)